MARERKNWPDDGTHSEAPGFPVPEGIKGWCFRCQAYCGGEGIKCGCCAGNPPPEAGAPATGGDALERQQKDPDLKDNSGSRP